MQKLYGNSLDLIGNTPLVSLSRYAEANELKARLLAKLEFFNPFGSVKDRIALAMIEAAEADGRLKPGSTIIEPTSGNTGIGLAAVGVAKGYRVVIVMPDSMSAERRTLVRARGAELILSGGKLGMKGAIARAREIADETPGSFIPMQFENPANPAIHRRTTGPEIWRDAEGRVDAFVAGVGSGGTITGVGGFLREQNPGVAVFAVEPNDSPVLSGGQPGPHQLQGIGPGFVPAVLDVKVYDEVMRVTGENAMCTAREIASREGLLIGVSAAAAIWAAGEVAKRPEYAGKTVVTLVPDGGEKYMSVGLYGH